MTATEFIRTHSFKVQNFDRVSLPVLCDQLYAVLAAATPVQPDIPVVITALYGLNAQAWRQSKFSQPGWHLRLPSAFSVLNATGSVISTSKVCSENQIVGGYVIKYPTDNNANVLEVELHELSAAVSPDKPRIEHKVLLWYLEQCSLRSKKPTYTEFKNLLDKLRRKQKKTNKSTKETISNIIKNYGSEPLVK